MSSHGLHTRLSVDACENCPLASLSSEAPIRQLQARGAEEPMQFVVDCDPSDCPATGCGFACSGGSIDMIQLGDQAVGRAELQRCDPRDDGCDCGCLLAGLEKLPIDPRQMDVEGGTVRMEFTLQDRGELQSVVAGLREAGLGVTLDSVSTGGDGDAAGGAPGAAMVALSELTARQREVAATAVAMGYFDPDGASAGEVADVLGIAKSTLSEHLGEATGAVFRQLFSNAAVGGSGDRFDRETRPDGKLGGSRNHEGEPATSVPPFSVGAVESD